MIKGGKGKMEGWGGGRVIGRDDMDRVRDDRMGV